MMVLINIEAYLVEALRRAHSCLDVEGLDVLPVLLEQGDEEVDGKSDILADLVLLETDVTDADTHAQDLLELELDSGSGVLNLILDGVSMRDQTRELAGLVETGTEDSRKLLDQRVACKETIVLLCQLLHELLVLVELLQLLNIHVVKTVLLGKINMHLITKNAHLHLASRMGKTIGTGETLVLLGIVVLKRHLKFDGLNELALLVL